MARWKVLNKDKAEELGIEEVTPDNEGFISVDLFKLPEGMTVKNVIEFAEKVGIIIKYGKPKV